MITFRGKVRMRFFHSCYVIIRDHVFSIEPNLTEKEIGEAYKFIYPYLPVLFQNNCYIRFGRMHDKITVRVNSKTFKINEDRKLEYSRDHGLCTQDDLLHRLQHSR